VKGINDSSKRIVESLRTQAQRLVQAVAVFKVDRSVSAAAALH
jgi:hypothetical protein